MDDSRSAQQTSKDVRIADRTWKQPDRKLSFSLRVASGRMLPVWQDPMGQSPFIGNCVFEIQADGECGQVVWTVGSVGDRVIVTRMECGMDFEMTDVWYPPSPVLDSWELIQDDDTIASIDRKLGAGLGYVPRHSERTWEMDYGYEEPLYSEFYDEPSVGLSRCLLDVLPIGLVDAVGPWYTQFRLETEACSDTVRSQMWPDLEEGRVPVLGESLVIEAASRGPMQSEFSDGLLTEVRLLASVDALGKCCTLLLRGNWGRDGFSAQHLRFEAFLYGPEQKFVAELDLTGEEIRGFDLAHSPPHIGLRDDRSNPRWEESEPARNRRVLQRLLEELTDSELDELLHRHRVTATADREGKLSRLEAVYAGSFADLVHSLSRRKLEYLMRLPFPVQGQYYALDSESSWMTDLQANLDELKEHQREARVLLAKSVSKSAAKASAAKRKPQNDE